MRHNFISNSINLFHKSLSSIILSKLMKRRNNNKANGNDLFVRIHTWFWPLTPVVCCLLYVGCQLSTPFNASTFNNTVHDFFQFINNTIFNNITSRLFWRFWCTIIHSFLKYALRLLWKDNTIISPALYLLSAPRCAFNVLLKGSRKGWHRNPFVGQ